MTFWRDVGAGYVVSLYLCMPLRAAFAFHAGCERRALERHGCSYWWVGYKREAVMWQGETRRRTRKGRHNEIDKSIRHDAALLGTILLVITVPSSIILL